MWARVGIFFIVLHSLKYQCSADSTSNASEPTNGFGIRFRLPFTDIELQTVSNVKIIKDASEEDLYVIHGSEFYQLFLGKNTKRLSLIATLEGDAKDSELLGAEIISWRDHVLLVVAIEEHLEVYQFAKKSIVDQTSRSANENATPLLAEPVQQITLQGSFLKVFLCEPSEDSVILIIAVNFTKLYSRLNIYQWTSTFFDPLQELTIAPIGEMKLIGSGTKYLVISRVSKVKTEGTVVVYNVKSTLVQVQDMELLYKSFQSFTYQGMNYMLSCSSGRRRCMSFKMLDGQFSVHKHRSAAEYHFNQFTAGEHFLVGQKNTEFSVYTDARMDCYGLFKTNDTDLTSIITHLNEEGNDFILLIYIRHKSALVRVVEIEYEMNLGDSQEDFDDDGDAVLKKQKHAFEESINKLRYILLSRKSAFDEIKKSIGAIQAKRRKAKFRSPVRIYTGQIGIVKVVGSKIRSPTEIVQRIRALANGERRTRFSRGLQDQNETAPMDVKIQSLRVGNLIYDGNLIPGFNLSLDMANLVISKPVTTKVLETKELLTAKVMESNRKPFIRAVGESVVKIKSLRVNQINGILWEEFYKNLFLRSRDRSIRGRLILQSSVQVGNLTTMLLNGLRPEKMFNLVEAQNVTSNIVISRFFVSDLKADTLNGLDFGRDIARSGVNNFIKTPVIAQDVTIARKLILSEKENQARHVFGTNVLDLQQTYTGKVIIDGSLTLANLDIENGRNTRFILNEKAVPINIASGFWMYSVPQTFEGAVSFTDCKLSTAALNTVYLNNWLLTDYFLNSHKQSKNPLLVIFLSAHIDGSLNADSEFGTKVRQISESAVKRGDRVKVHGEKIFQGSLTFDHGDIGFLNDLPTSELVGVNEKKCIFRGVKSFKSIHITNEAVITNNLNLINRKLQPHQKEYRFDTIVLRSPLKAQNVIFTYLNGFPSNKLFSSIRSFEDKLILHKDLYVVGNIQFEADLQADVINGIIWEEYMRSLVRINENTVISGTKIINSSLTIVNELKTPSISGLDIDHFLNNILLKSRHQIISGSYTFDSIQLSNIDVPYVNEFPTSAFIDTRLPEVIFNCDMVVDKLKIYGNLYGNVDVDLNSLDERIKTITHKSPRNLKVLGNAYWPWDDDDQSLNLQYLFTHAVRHLDDQVITGNVKLRKPLIGTMSTKENFPKDIDFEYITKDGLFHNSSAEEVVLAAKTFIKPIQIAEVVSYGHLSIPLVNGIDILDFNTSLYRLSNPTMLYGPLTFEVPPIFGDLTVQGTINNVDPNQLFLVQNGHEWPPIKFQSLHVEGHLQLFNIDHMNLDFLLKNRIRKSGRPQKVYGHLSFEHLVLEKDISIKSINNIPIDNIVCKNTPQLQEITAPKIILGDLLLHGPTKVNKLDGEDMIERYHKTIFLNQDYNFDSLSITRAEFKNGLSVKSSIAMHSLSGKTQNISHKQTFLQHTETLKKIESNLREIEAAIDSKIMNPKRLVYLDYDFSTIIEWKLTNDSIQEKFIFESNRYQYCDREQTIIKWSKYHNRITLNKIITNVIQMEEHGIKVIAENVCKESYRKAISRISITEGQMTKRFTFQKLITGIDIFYGKDKFILFHAIDFFAGNNEVRIFRIDNNSKTVRDWQLLTDGVGKVSKLFKLQSHTIFVVSTIVDNYPSVTIYNFNVDRQIFEVIQVIDGDFDVIELAQVSPHTYHLFLSCVHCQKIVIFEYDSYSSSIEDCHTYNLFQIIKLKTRIDRFNLFTLPDGGIYLLILSDQDIDFYHIYKYKYIQGWKHFTYGYFKNIQNAYPLLKGGLSSVDDNLLLLCNRKCTLVKAFYQW